MSSGIRNALIAVVGLIGLLAAGVVIGPRYAGETVRLTTTKKTGEPAQTYLWIVDDGEALYIRASDPRSEWVARLERNPRVRLERAGATASYRAEPLASDSIRTYVNGLMAEKYGFWDRLDAVRVGHGTSLPIRLEPER